MNEEEAIERLKKDKNKPLDCGDITIVNIDDLEIVLNLLEKKDKMIDLMGEYAQQEIDFATEDIKDYIDDDREGNKDIIGELKEWREHWKDIIRIMNNEKTYIDFEYKVEEKN